MCHFTPAWVTKQDPVSKIKKNSQSERERERERETERQRDRETPRQTLTDSRKNKELY